MLKKKIILAAAAAMALGVLSAAAQELEGRPVSPKVINKSLCSQEAGNTKPFILVLDRGDELVSSISQCALEAGLNGALISGLGQVAKPELLYSPGTFAGDPTIKEFSGVYELASLSGNIATSKGKYFTHVHGVLADSGYHVLAGHIKSAQVGNTVEVAITPLIGRVVRNVAADKVFGPLEH
jgi:uncharacterized protein